MRSGGSEQIHPTQVVAPRSFRRMYGEPPAPPSHRHHHQHHHHEFSAEHRNASDGEDNVGAGGEGVGLNEDDGSETGVVLDGDQGVEVVLIGDQSDEIVSLQPRPEQSVHKADQSVFRTSSNGSPHPHYSPRGTEYGYQPRGHHQHSSSSASGHRSHEIPYSSTRSRSFEGAEDHHASYHRPPPSSHSHYSPQVTYPGPRSSSVSNANGSHYSPSDDVNVISPSHKPDYNRPPPHHSLHHQHPPSHSHHHSSYQYPPASPVRRESARSSQHHHRSVPSRPVISRREHQRYAASSASLTPTSSRSHPKQSFHPDDGTFNVYPESSATAPGENYVSPQPHYPSVTSGPAEQTSGGASGAADAAAAAPPPPPHGSSNNYVSPHPNYPSPRRRHRPPSPPLSSSHHVPPTHYQSSARYGGHHHHGQEDFDSTQPPPHFDDYRYYGGAGSGSHQHHDASPYPPHYGSHGPPPHVESSPYPSHYGSSSSVTGGGYAHHHPPSAQPHHHHYDHHYEDDRYYYPSSSHHRHPHSGAHHHHHPAYPPSPAGAHLPHHPRHSHPTRDHAASLPPKTKNGILLPDAALEVDFEVTCPPPEPSLPPSDHPVCSGPSELNTHDVLCGRGGGTNSQIGNRRFRKLVQEFQPTYLLARRKEKPLLARTIVLIIRKRGGRFLKKDEETGELFEVGDAKAEAKTSQALREGLDVRATKANAATLLEKKKKNTTTSNSSNGVTNKSGSATTILTSAAATTVSPTKVPSSSNTIAAENGEYNNKDSKTAKKDSEDERDKENNAGSATSTAITPETADLQDNNSSTKKEEETQEGENPPSLRSKTPPKSIQSDDAMTTPPPTPPPSLPKLAGIIHPHSPEALQFRKRRRMRSGEGCLGMGAGGSLVDDKLFPDFCPPRADLGRAGSPTMAAMLDQDDEDHVIGRSGFQSPSQPEDDGYIQGRGGCAGIAMGMLAGSGFCLGPSNWSRRRRSGGSN